MKQVIAYQSSDGRIHANKTKAGRAEIEALDRKDRGTSSALSLDDAALSFIVRNRKEIVKILQEVDMPDAKCD